MGAPCFATSRRKNISVYRTKKTSKTASSLTRSPRTPPIWRRAIPARNTATTRFRKPGLSSVGRTSLTWLWIQTRLGNFMMRRSLRRERKPHISVQCADLIFVPCASLRMFVSTRRSKSSQRNRHYKPAWNKKPASLRRRAPRFIRRHDHISLARRSLGEGGCSMKITEDVRKYAAERGLTESEAIESGMQEKRKEFLEKGAEIYAKT